MSAARTPTWPNISFRRLQMRGDEEFQRYLAAVLSAMFENPRNPGATDEVANVLSEAGISPQLFLELINDEKVKEQLKRNTEDAVSRGKL